MGVKTICKVSKRINVKNICNLAKGYMSKQKNGKVSKSMDVNINLKISGVLTY